MQQRFVRRRPDFSQREPGPTKMRGPKNPFQHRETPNERTVREMTKFPLKPLLAMEAAVIGATALGYFCVENASAKAAEAAVAQETTATVAQNAEETMHAQPKNAGLGGYAVFFGMMQFCLLVAVASYHANNVLSRPKWRNYMRMTSPEGEALSMENR